MKKTKRIVSIILLAVTVMSVILITSCGKKRSTDFKTIEDMANYLEGTWQNQEDKTYIFIKKGEIEHSDEDGDYCFLNVSRYSFPAKANWNSIFENLYLTTYSADELNDKTYYCSDNNVMLAISLHGEFNSFLGFTCTNESVESKTIGIGFENANFFDCLKINEDGTIMMNGTIYEGEGENKVSKKGPEMTYEFVSSDPEWFFKSTKNLWIQAAKKELSERKDRFDKFKAFYCDKTKFSDIKMGDVIELNSYIYNGFEMIKNANLYDYGNINDKMNMFLYAIGYFSTLDENDSPEVKAMADKGWEAIEDYVYLMDTDKTQSAWEEFRSLYNKTSYGSIIPIK